MFRQWLQGGATWYGSPSGGGSDGGACGFNYAVENPPFYKMVSAGGPSLYNNGNGCGACYRVKCTDNQACSRRPVTITITDECPGCVAEPFHFDLSGTAFGALAKPGQADNLRNAGVLQLLFRRVKCKYPGVTIAFHVDAGSNPFYFAMVSEYEDGDGDLGAVELKQSGGDRELWHPMQHSWGATWMLNLGSQLQPPFSIRLTTLTLHHTLVAHNVIPFNCQPGQTYRSWVNFKT
ncbi:expansin-B15 [Ziziphus jujuba]|uniref:Expansin-B15 n=1 Tax=Ziziphus jujuba TaxID=326968 RepID=A0ABM3IS87_ZIZJJ|nr:expansin-B15 [Ziziphus jujuba]